MIEMITLIQQLWRYFVRRACALLALFSAKSNLIGTPVMPRYVVRFVADSCVRLNRKSYFDAADCRTVTFVNQGMTISLFDQFIGCGGTELPSGLIVQVDLDADTIDEAIQNAGSRAVGTLNILSCVGAAAIYQPLVTLAYDLTSNVTDREVLTFSYDRQTPRSTKQPNDADLAEFVRAYDAFHSDVNISDDHKLRVGRAIDAYRRGLADNNDPLTEFIVLWSSIEGMDCVYRKTFPSRRSDFKDGMKDVFTRLGKAGLFNVLEDLRNKIAHGNLDLNAANQTAVSNMELTRKAVLFMALRIIRCDDVIRDRIIFPIAYKGSVKTTIKLHATAQFQPGDVRRLDGHPQIEAKLANVTVTPTGDTVNMTPQWNFVVNNVNSYEIRSVQLHGDSGANVRVKEMGISVTPFATS